MSSIRKGPVLLGATVLLLGAGAMALLMVFKRAPAEATVEPEEEPIHVEVRAVSPEDVPVQIEGFGEVAPKREITITPQVTGNVISRHPALVVGGQVQAGELLFEIDPRPFAAQVAEAEAQLARQEITLRRLEGEGRNLEADLESLQRTGELAEQDFARARKLHDEGVGSQSAMDEAERALVAARNEIDKISRDLELHPIRLREAESEIDSAQARLEKAQVDLDRTRMVAPFTGRVTDVQVEAGEVLLSGTPAVNLADDSVLEIAVPLNSRDARRWLKFKHSPSEETATWFGDLEPVPCQIRWTEGAEDAGWEGRLDRVASYDPGSRTVTVVVRVEGQNILSRDRFPLVAGMFCAVSIPGRPMESVYRLEPHVVSFDNTVYVARGDRLKTVPVEIARIEEEYTYVSSGLEPGDRVITTRLVNPLDQSLLAISREAEPAR